MPSVPITPPSGMKTASSLAASAWRTIDTGSSSPYSSSMRLFGLRQAETWRPLGARNRMRFIATLRCGAAGIYRASVVDTRKSNSASASPSADGTRSTVRSGLTAPST